MDLNLDTLKNSIAEHLEKSDFAIYRHDSGVFDASLVVTWDTETYPDFQMFLEAARKLGVRMILFASRVLEESEIAEIEEDLESTEIARDDKRDYSRALDNFREHAGKTCSIELAFQFETHFYLYEARADWYEEFVGLTDEITAFTAVEDDEVDSDSDGSIGGFYSKN